MSHDILKNYLVSLEKVETHFCSIQLLEMKVLVFLYLNGPASTKDLVTRFEKGRRHLSRVTRRLRGKQRSDYKDRIPADRYIVAKRNPNYPSGLLYEVTPAGKELLENFAVGLQTYA